MNDLLRARGDTLRHVTTVASPLAVEVSAVMVVYMTGPALFDSIASVLAEPRLGELVIVDNGSTREDAARLRPTLRRSSRWARSSAPVRRSASSRR